MVDDPGNSIFAYATARNQVAEDGYGVNSLYTKRLLSLIRKPGLSATDLFHQVAVLVKQETSDKQQPWQSFSLDQEFYFAGKKSAEEPESVDVPVYTGW